VDQKYLESFDMLCSRRIQKVSCTDHARNEVWQRAKKKKNILHTIKMRKVDLIGYTLRRNCLLKHAIKGNLEKRMEVTRRRGIRRTQLLDDRKQTIWYWKLKEKELARALWRTLWKGLWTCCRTNCVLNEWKKDGLPCRWKRIFLSLNICDIRV
jgi:hypothetical protein